jgi:hypothetical protein
MAVIGRGSPILVSALALATTLVLRAASPDPQAPPPLMPAVDFVKDVQPILEKHCYECHGTKKVKGRLRLHSPAFIAKGGENGPVIVAGDPEHSLMMRRVLGLDGEDRMPLDADPLNDGELATLRGWIAAGAALPAAAQTTGTAADTAEHWAYLKPVRPPLPDVSRQAWVRTPIDRFVLARLDKEQLTPSPEADRHTLLRRVTLDLTGLPPTLEEIDAFLADAAPGAYERAVDRLLASPRYGERWARPWLDLARYADTNGYEKDKRRDMWKYRDWVIDALNADMPFDRFTIEQVAGDMLPDATEAQRIASGFHRNAMTNEEGGVDPDESMYEVLVDRVNTTATVWLGTTLACAQCHNHKYDPFSQKDYFRLLAFFANPAYETQVSGDGTRFYEAKLDLASAEQASKRKAVQTEIKRLEAVLAETTPELARQQRAWEADIRAAEGAWTALPPRDASATNGVRLTPQPDGSLLASGPNAELTIYTVTFETKAEGLTGLRLEALPDASLPRGGPGRDAYGHFRVTGLSVSIAPLSGGRESPLAIETIRVDDAASSFEPMDLLGGGASGGGRGKRGAWGINALREKTRLPRRAVLQAARPFGFAGGTRITLQIAQEDGSIGQGVGRFRVAVTAAADPLIGATLPPLLRPVVLRDATTRAAGHADDVAAHFRQTTPSLKPTREALKAARKALVDLQLPSTLVMQDRPGFERPSYELRERGAFMARGERMYARTPLALPPMKDSLPPNRLGLARWLVDRDNPLVARVQVNRLWEQLFGRGLVETSEDFGTQGQPPSHPELLDWLAVELIDRGWSQKTLLRTIVTSATYRQSSVVAAALAERDPYNRLFARGPRFRLEAEMIRDGELAASGLLSGKMHGPSVFPAQPEGIWNMPYNEDRWVESEGEDRHRRSLYTFLRRTSPYPMHMTFDATSREYCAARRVRTNTPLQALTLLNDRASFDAARALAARLASVPAAAARATRAFRLVVARDPKPAELARLLAYVDAERTQFARRPAAARSVAPAPVAGQSAADAAAWTLAASVLLNLDETVTKN